MLKLFGVNRDPEPTLPDDSLSPTSHLLRGRAVFQCQAGLPQESDGLAYDPVQRLLAVSSACESCSKADCEQLHSGLQLPCCTPSAGQHS